MTKEINKLCKNCTKFMIRCVGMFEGVSKTCDEQIQMTEEKGIKYMTDEERIEIKSKVRGVSMNDEMKEKMNELMNRISLALKDATLQQGFEIICKRISELEKENEQLKEKLEHRNCIDCSNHGKQIEVLKLKSQIEKMKCCDNCKHLGIFYDEELGTIANCVYLVECQDGYNKWELKE